VQRARLGEPANHRDDSAEIPIKGTDQLRYQIEVDYPASSAVSCIAEQLAEKGFNKDDSAPAVIIPELSIGLPAGASEAVRLSSNGSFLAVGTRETIRVFQTTQ
jgi:hypothetical protein